MKKGDGLFRKVCAEVAERYPEIEYNDIIVDNCTMQSTVLNYLKHCKIFVKIISEVPFL